MNFGAKSSTTLVGNISADVYPVARFVPRSLQVVPSRQFRRDRRAHNPVSLNNSRSIRRRSSVSPARMEAARFVGLTRDNNDNAVTSHPSPLSLSLAFNFLIFSVLRRSFEAIVTVRYDCSISRSVGRSVVRSFDRSQVADDYKRYARTHPVYRLSRDRRSSGDAQGVSPFFLVILYSRLSSR